MGRPVRPLCSPAMSESLPASPADEPAGSLPVAAPHGATEPVDSAKGTGLFALVKDAAWDFMDDNCLRLAAAMSYYTIFALPGLLVLLVTILAWAAGVTGVGDDGAAQSGIEDALAQTTGLQGEEEKGQIGQMMESAALSNASPLKWVLTFGSILFAATGVIIALQDSLNTAWEVAPDPEAGGVKNFLMKRLVSLAMILAVGFLLIVSLTLTAAVEGFTKAIETATGMPSADVLARLGSEAVTVLVVTALFAAIFKYLPDAVIAWKDALIGGFVTALLFWIGKFALGFYLGRSDFAGSFGAGAASLALVLTWVYYNSVIFLFGAEFTQKWADRRGSGIVPEEGAVRVRKTVVKGAAAAAPAA